MKPSYVSNSSFNGTRDLRLLWMLRMLVRLGALSALADAKERADCRVVFELIGLPMSALGSVDSIALLHEQLASTLQRMESRAEGFRHAAVLRHNLGLVGQQFGLVKTECELLAFAALLRSDEAFFLVGRFARPQVNLIDQLTAITGLRHDDVEQALALRASLRRCGLISTNGVGSPVQAFVLRPGKLRSLATARLRSADELFSSFLTPCGSARLTPHDYRHFSPGFDLADGIFAEAIASRRAGVNVLVHGAPGVGKSELARTIAARIGVPLFEVSSMDDAGDGIDARSRLANAATAQYLLGERRSLLVFDEVDAIFTDGSRFFGKPTTAEQSKAWVNTLLETNRVPTLWLANNIEGMDPAFLRRFDLVVELASPPLAQRAQMVEAVCGNVLGAGDIRRIAQSDAITPAVLSRAMSVCTRVAAVGHAPAAMLEYAIDGTLRAQGHRTIGRSCVAHSAGNYDPDCCNASEDLARLAAGVARVGSARICLYGPPGTGKTAFGYWLAESLGKPLVLKRVSDLQSPFIGVMERNLAKAFEQASRDGAVLQLDEVDSFVRDRRDARNGWEVSQVNEFLTQLEAFDGVLVATTNVMDGLDPAALRRYDYRIEVEYLRADQAWRMLARCLDGLHLPADEATRTRLGAISNLTPGDFAVIARRHRLMPFESASGVINALRLEVEAKGLPSRRIGFV